MTQYTDQQMLARQEALRNVRSIEDWYRMYPQHRPNRWAKPANDKIANTMQHALDLAAGNAPALPGKVMQSRYNGRCADCNGWIQAGETIRYDGKAHHYPACSQEVAADPMADWDDEKQGFVDFSAVPAEETPVAATTGSAVADGKWTLQFPDGSHKTFKINTQKADAKFAPGERVVKYLAKSDNEDENSYVGFAFIKGDKLVIWKRFHNDSTLATQAQYLLNPTAAEAAGKAYALASGCCYRCGHELTDPISIQAGLGPDCRKKVLG